MKLRVRKEGKMMAECLYTAVESTFPKGRVLSQLLTVAEEGRKESEPKVIRDASYTPLCRV